MPASRERVEELVAHPREALDIELKSWFDPDSNHGIAKLVKACIALRNNDGGFLVVGLDDDQHAVSAPDPATKWWENFHQDKIQQLVTRYASELFEIHVHLVPHEGHQIPVIEIESGFKNPVAAKSDLSEGGKKFLVRDGAVYVRSLSSNGSVSTSDARHKDWPRIMDLCFDNREADIGRFVRRHIGPSAARELAHALSDIEGVRDNSEPPAREFLDDCFPRFTEAVVRRQANESGLEIPSTGSLEIASVAVPAASGHSNNDAFRLRIGASTPTLTGWPFWADSSNFHAIGSHPYVLDGGWEALLFDPREDVVRKHLDFWRIEPTGRFYALRAFEDDLSAPARGFEAGEMLEFAIQILRVAEAMHAAVQLSCALGCPPDSGSVSIALRWKGLAGRTLSTWASPGRSLSMEYKAVQDEVTSSVEIPLDVPASAMPSIVSDAIAPLFALFKGFEAPTTVVADLVNRLLERRL